ncbi:hypothetical protein CBS9595_001413 [Malassezia furfur]|nr:hypothetical protein CBS9595_001413 [Malassezia furfur]
MSFLPSRLSLTARATLRTVSRAAQPMAARTLTTSMARFDAAHPPIIQGPGAPDGTMPTDENQSTGLERFELYGKLEGVDVFEQEPLPADRLGTMKDPIKVRSMYHEHHIGCTGFPAESHETLWLNMSLEKEHTRCPRCGSVYQLEYLGEPVNHHH